LVNPNDVWYEYEEPQTQEGGEVLSEPRLVFFEGDSIVDASGKVKIDTFGLLEEGWSKGAVVLATPNIPLKDLEYLRKAFIGDADAESLDLEVILYTSLKGVIPSSDKRWSLGWEDGNSIQVHLFPKEFFDASSKAKSVLMKDIAPSLLD